MANKWNIPSWLEIEILKRDLVCVYCDAEFTTSKVSHKSAASWEHIINDLNIVTRENIVRCCCRCNSSKGKKQLSVWLKSKYCLELGINPSTVAPIVRQAIENGQ